MHNVTIIRGDGIGPELSEASVKVINATGVKINWDWVEAGIDEFERSGNPLPDSVLSSVKKNRVALKAPITTPVGSGFKSVTVSLRKHFDLFASIRPVKLLKGVSSKFENVDIVVIRENLEDLYSGIEFSAGSKEMEDLSAVVNNLYGPNTLKSQSAVSLKVITPAECERVAKYAFEYAQKYNRRKVTAVHKGNNLKETDGLFLNIAKEIAKNYPEIEFNDLIIDNMCMQIVRDPSQFDIILAPNLYGDILSDLIAGMAGGLGLAPSANIGDDVVIFEATHGSAPKYKGLNKVNPSAFILAGCMLLEYLGETKAAIKIRNAIIDVIAEGKNVTYDLKAPNERDTAVGTQEMAEAIIYKMNNSKVELMQ
jgi:isocitrate dehydrogenase (NAD+)